MLVSVIVPIYNTERFLQKCLESIVCQTYPDLDIVLIDDGSTDGCVLICDTYGKKDDRIRVFHQENSGAVASRAFGLSVATGEYLIFVDSDDYIAPDMCERMLRLAISADCDMVWCNVNVVMSAGTQLASIKYTNFTDEMIHRILRGEVPGWLGNKLIKRAFYNSANIQSYPADSMLEDMLQSIELLCANPKMGYVNRPLYYYNRMNESAMTAGHKTDVIIKGLNNIKHIYDYLVAKDLFEVYSSDFAFLAMTTKLALLHKKGISAAKRLYPYAHKYRMHYKMHWPVSWIYWMGFNGGKLGAWLITSYLKIHKGKK